MRAWWSRIGRDGTELVVKEEYVMRQDRRGQDGWGDTGPTRHSDGGEEQDSPVEIR